MELENPAALPTASANNARSSLLPAKSRDLYEKTYNLYLCIT
jgi:hypothetical protein